MDDPRAGWPFSFGWHAAIEDERLIDLGEWAECRHLPPPLPLPSAFTSALWDAIESVPMSRLHDESVEKRTEAVLRRAGIALETALKRLPPGAAPCFTLEVGAPLSCARTSKEWCRLRIYCGPTDQGGCVAVVGLAGGVDAGVPA